ncbi:hypothetical protein Hanom_Chr07g00591351 [Helianthus anomalus]
MRKSKRAESEQNLLKDLGKEVCSFDNADISALRASDAFPPGAIIRPFDRNIRSDVSSKESICFFAYPFSIGLRYHLSDFIVRFYHLTGLSFAQTMPMVWRVLVVLDQIMTHHIPDLCIEDLPIAYRLRSHGSSRFFLFSTSKNPLVLKATKNEDEWKRKFFFVKRESIDKGVDFPVKWLTTANFKELAPPSAELEQRINAVYQLPESERTFSLFFTSSSQKSSSDMSAPAKIPEVFDLEELDNYSGPVAVKKEPSPKPATSSKPASSKDAAIPKPSPATKPRASSVRKRKETDSHATPDAFPYENHGFVESSGHWR